MNDEMADFLMESALKDMGIEAEMKEMAIVKKEPTATSILLTYNELYQMKEEGAREKCRLTYTSLPGGISERFELKITPVEEHIPFAKKLKR